MKSRLLLSLLLLALVMMVASCDYDHRAVLRSSPKNQIDFSKQRNDFRKGRLVFIEVRDDGSAVFRYTTDRPYLVTGKPGEALHGENGTASAFWVESTSVSEQAVSIRFRDLFDGKGQL